MIRRPVSAVLRESRITSTRGRAGGADVEREQLPHQRKGDARREDLVLALALVAVVRLDALLLEHAVRLLQVEQRTGGDRDYELAVEGDGHRGGGSGGHRPPSRRF